MRSGTRRLALRTKPKEQEDRLDQLVSQYLYKNGGGPDISATREWNKSSDNRQKSDNRDAGVSYVVPSSPPKPAKQMSAPKQKLFSDLNDTEPADVYEDAVESPEVDGENQKKTKKKKPKQYVDSSSSTNEFVPSSFGIHHTSLGSQNSKCFFYIFLIVGKINL